MQCPHNIKNWTKDLFIFLEALTVCKLRKDSVDASDVGEFSEATNGLTECLWHMS